MNRLQAALAECEARLHHLTDKSAYCYWEQDADFRFTYFSGPFLGKAATQNPGLGAHLWDTPVLNLPDAGWAAHRALVQRHDSFHDFEIGLGDEGNPQWFSLSGEPMFDDAGAFKGYRGVVREVTARRLRDEALLRFRAAIDATADAIHLVDCESMRFIDVNETGHRFLGYTREEFLALQIPDIAPNVDMQATRRHYQTLSPDMRTEQWAEVWLRHKNGVRFPVEIRRRGAFIGGQRIAVNVLRDITRAKHSESIIRRHALQQSLIAAFGQSALANIGIDALLERAVSAVREGLEIDFCRLHQLDETGQSAVLTAGSGWDAGWMGSTDHDFGPRSQNRYVLSIATPVVVEDFMSETRFVVSALVREHAIRSGVDVPIIGVSGSYGILGVYSKAQRLFTSDHVSYLQSLVNTLATAMDRRRAEDRLTLLAQFDALTGLPNRSLFLDRFEQTLATGERSNWRIGVLFVDLDHFKAVNDTLGHAAGDRLLIQVAHRLKECVRPGDTVGRLSGDEFAIVLANLSRTEDARLVAQKVVAALRLPFVLEGDQVHISASVGIAIYPSDGLLTADLMKNADKAMYDAKAAGRDTFR
jgi:diguanylate cyclase (GGDEF)-like protein/PAS domain S-box-containing protein